MLCIAEEFLRALTDIFNKVMLEDMELYKDMSKEEYNLVKPSDKVKAESTGAMLKTFLVDNGKCGNCTEWQMAAGEIRGADDTKILEVGFWRPVQGTLYKDDLFPHVTGGLRGRAVTITSIDVRIENSP